MKPKKPKQQGSQAKIRKHSLSINQFLNESNKTPTPVENVTNLSDLNQATSLPTSIFNLIKNQSQTILEPVRLKNTQDNNNNNTNKNTNSNLKDLLFDSSLDPFNDLELKTINDLEELKKF